MNAAGLLAHPRHRRIVLDSPAASRPAAGVRRAPPGPPNGDGSIPFSASFHLSANRTFDYKYRVVDAGGVVGRWEKDPNETCDVPVGGRTCDSKWDGT